MLRQALNNFFLQIKDKYMENKRCQWAQNSYEAYEKYHDEEWGVEVHDDKIQFESNYHKNL